MLQYDDILKNVVGEFGIYQKRNCVLLCVMAMTVSIGLLSPVFLHSEVDHWCRVPESESIFERCRSINISGDGCIDIQMNLTIPKEMRFDGDECQSSLKFSRCLRYESSEETNYTNSSLKVISCDHGWVYDTRTYTSTVMQEFDLVCDDYYLGALITSVYMSGYLVGNFIFGPLSDRIGRLKTLMISLCGLEVFGVASAFASNVVMFSVFRFLSAVFLMGQYLQIFILATEYVGPSKRPVVFVFFMLMYAAGYVTLAVIAFLIRTWRMLLLALTLPSLLFLSYFCIIDESPRWLISVGKEDKAVHIVKKMARVNKVMEIDYCELFTVNDNNEEIKKNSTHVKEVKRSGIIDLVKHHYLRKITIIMCFAGGTSGMTYYGFSFNTSNLGGNDFIIAGIAGAVEIPGNLLMFVMIKSVLGRRFTFCIFAVLGGLASLITAFLPKCGDLIWINLTVSMIGKCAITSAYNLSWIYAAELFPTVVRSLGVSMTSVCGMLGSILAPQILLARKLWSPLPQVIFGAMPILAGLLILLLPETRGKKLPETIGGGHSFGRERQQTNVENPEYAEGRRGITQNTANLPGKHSPKKDSCQT
ncbi:organic cation transporter protein-like [Ptychodera flava]|uniref:organic cation transporter protein-like n=1 Tax=Ptychodera flava TaxID=63121 RepID=UPI00396A154A